MQHEPNGLQTAGSARTSILDSIGVEYRSWDYQIMEFNFERNFEIPFNDESDWEFDNVASDNEIKIFTGAPNRTLE